MKKININKIIALYIIIAGIILFMSSDLSRFATALEYVGCGSAEGIPKPLPQLTTIAYTILVTGTPLVLIVTSIITLVRALSGGHEDEIGKARVRLFIKFTIAIVIFLTASIAKFAISRVTSNSNDSKSLTECISCFLYYNGTDDGDNCHVSSSGNNVTDETHSNAYSNIGEPTTSNRHDRPNAKDRLTFYNSLSVLHSGQLPNDNTLSLFESAGKAKFYAAECDLRMSGSTLYCAHNRGPSTATKFEDYLNICRQYNMMAILDIKYASIGWNYNYTSMLNTLGDYINNNRLQDRVIVQTVNLSTMNQINSRVSGVKYWFLITNNSGYSTFTSNMASYKSAGVVGVNMQFTMVSEDKVKNVRNNGFTACIYSVDGDAARAKYSGYGAEYIMTNALS